MADVVDCIGGVPDWGATKPARAAAGPVLGDMPVLGTGEDHTLTSQVDYGLRCVFDGQFGRALVHQPVVVLDGVVVMSVLVIGFHTTQAHGDAALG